MDPSTGTPHRLRIGVVALAMVAVLLLGTTAAFAAGAFESDDSGLDAAHDRAERGLVSDDPSTTSTTVADAPDDPLPAPSAPAGANVAGNDARTEDESFVTLPAGATQSFAAGDAGVVTIRRDGGSLTVVDVRANAGWRPEVEQGAGLEVEVHFENGMTRVDFNAELEDGAVRILVRVRADGADDDAVTPTSPTSPTSAPVVNDPPRVDNSGPGSLSSGPGSGDDQNGDDRIGDDHSGSGHGSDDQSDDHSGSDLGGSGHGGDD